MTSRTSRRRRGAPQKAPGGLTEVLFVRVEPELIDGLEDLRELWSEEQGHTLSRADVVRAILREAVQRC